MRESLTMRAYEPALRTHSHDFHQIVVPLRGSIEISLGGFNGDIGVGHCVIIQRNVEHSFNAKQHARFLVADLRQLPPSAKKIDSPFATVSNAFRSFCIFADIQISSQLNPALEDNVIAVFKQLLELQDFLPEIDPRISRATQYIEDNLAKPCTLEQLASVSSLSVSQFKALFSKHTGKPVRQYLLALRMEKARGLLANTDMPIGIVAEMTGYTDASAFSRRFQSHYGTSPREYKKQ